MVFNPSDTVTAQLTYDVPPPDGVEPFLLVDYESGPLTGGNVSSAVHEVVVENIRGKEHLYTLDDEGFQFFRRPTKHTDFNQPEDYYHESAEFVKEITGANRVVLFSPVQRRRPSGEEANSTQKKKPSGTVHVDVSASGAVRRVHMHAPSETSDILRRRFQVINLWRPIAHPAYDWPLAVCAWSSINPKSDIFTVTRLRSESKGSEATVKYNEMVGVSYNPNHQWKYLRGMTPDDVLVFKNYDSDGSVAVCTPHTAFEDPTTPKDSLPRESIELRFLVFYD
ncbi:hypothetical protein L218DRAFT_961930 [Marasmius fiardii PR-910]|nr:hypothetical protein L218DRAFT_961930 [Marasmius fiardii PR-910]